ncbi:Mitochondrial import inner membrane translocase subunit TIM50, partial [Fragariocoptes setiger]
MAAKRLLNLSPWTKLGIGMAAATGVAASVVIEYGQEKDGQSDEHSKLPWGLCHSMRAWRRIREDIRTTFEEPSQPVLLPPPLGAAYGHTPYTLAIELNGVLVHPEWTYRTGWRFKKRPYIDYFLKQCGPPMFEIVIYTQDQGHTAYPLIDGLDPQGYISYRLFKDSTKYIKGTHVKELNQLGRDMKRVIHLDWNSDACQSAPNNCLILRKWDGSSDDKTLVELSDFIREIASQGVEDVRPVLKHYAQFDDPIAAFKENQRRVEEAKAQTPSLPAWKLYSGKAT